jgi:hypothetical protein
MGGRLALYFGYGDGGHFLRDPNRWQMTLDPRRNYPGFPWREVWLDTGLLTNRKVPDNPDGRVHWVAGGKPDTWHAFVWWDRSGDRRGASNSGFYVRGFALDEIVAAFEYACSVWPEVVERQAFPLRLVEHAAPRSDS